MDYRLYLLLIIYLLCVLENAHGFVIQPLTTSKPKTTTLFVLLESSYAPHLVSTSFTDDHALLNYAPAAATLFANMLTPASILAAGIISIGLKKAPEPPESIRDQPELVQHLEKLTKAYITVTLVSFCSELLAVTWATVAVNQLTERSDIAPAFSVWELLQRDFNLEWAATNSHFVLGLVGFMYMVGIRGYIMLLEAQASQALILSTLSGVGAALLLMVSIVNQGVSAGGGALGETYGTTVLDLFGQYAVLLYQRAMGEPYLEEGRLGPLKTAAILLEVFSIACAAYAVFSPLILGEWNKKDSNSSNSTAKDVVNGGNSDKRDNLQEILQNGDDSTKSCSQIVEMQD